MGEDHSKEKRGGVVDCPQLQTTAVQTEYSKSHLMGLRLCRTGVVEIASSIILKPGHEQSRE